MPKKCVHRGVLFKAMAQMQRPRRIAGDEKRVVVTQGNGRNEIIVTAQFMERLDVRASAGRASWRIGGHGFPHDHIAGVVCAVQELLALR